MNRAVNLPAAPPRPARRHALRLLLGAPLAAVLAACGRKGPPVKPVSGTGADAEEPRDG